MQQHVTFMHLFNFRSSANVTTVSSFMHARQEGPPCCHTLTKRRGWTGSNVLDQRIVLLRSGVQAPRPLSQLTRTVINAIPYTQQPL